MFGTRNPRLCSTLALGVLASALTGPMRFPAVASAQETKPAVTCWAESCSGNVCVRIQIECPKEIKPITPDQ